MRPRVRDADESLRDPGVRNCKANLDFIESNFVITLGHYAVICKKADYGATCGAVKAGKAKAGVVKNWWWEANKNKFPMLAMYRIPGVSIEKNPDNVLTASKAIPAYLLKKIADAAIASKDAFGAPEMAPFDQSRLEFSLGLMKKGKIDPLAYNW